jgi:hypothetical protein
VLISSTSEAVGIKGLNPKVDVVNNLDINYSITDDRPVSTKFVDEKLVQNWA